jgi:lipopolysaccharide/colanic/teichoic acid biosynthesis glycosyltransferase
MESRIFIILYYMIFLLLLILVRLVFIRRVLESSFNTEERKTVCGFAGAVDMFAHCKTFCEMHRITGLVLSRDCDDCTELFLYSHATDYDQLYAEIKASMMSGKKLHIASHLFTELELGWEWCDIVGVPVYTFQQKKNQTLRDIVRRAIDIIGSAVCLILLAPLFAVISLIIVTSSPGPAMYKQKRCGKSGTPFTLYKFRSMYKFNSKSTEKEIATYNYMKKRTSKVKALNNEDITDIGRILRKTSLDESPQFMNVLKGDMSLIGPRPPLPYEVKHYKKWHRDRLLVKQGLTGLWQIHGRGEMPCDKSIFLDLVYVMNRSLTLDVKLLFQTIPAVILGKGAY